MALDSFNVYHSYLKALEPLNDAECGRLLKACLQYSMTGVAPELRGNERFLFPSWQSQIDRDRDKYAAKCRRNSQNASMRWDATACERMRNDAKHAKDKDKDNDNNTIPPIYPPQRGQRAQDGEPKGSPPPAAAGEKQQEYSADFTAFWKSYPSWRATDKAGCYRKFKKIPKDQLPRLMESLEAHKRSKQWRDGIIPLASTWLNQRRWESDAPPEEPAKKPSRKGQDYPQHAVSEANLAHMFVKLDE